MLYTKAQNADLHRIFAKGSVSPLFPPRSNRNAWTSLPPSVTQPWITLAEEHKEKGYPSLPMSLYLQVKRTGESFTGWQVFCIRRALLGTFLLAECMEDQGRFLDAIIDGIYTISEETSWVQNVNMRSKGMALPTEEDNYPDLCSTETAQLFGWILYYVGDRLDQEDKGIRERMLREVRRRVLQPYLDRSDYWWMGLGEGRINNWNPWCNMNVLQAIACLEYEPEFRASIVEKVCESLDVYIARYPDDGACDEGPMYWGAAGAGLGKCVELLRWITNGAVDGSQIEKLKNIGSYFSKVHIHGEWYVDYADGDAKVDISPSVYRFGKLLGDETLMAHGRATQPLAPNLYTWFSTYDYLVSIFDSAERNALLPRAPYLKSAWFDVCQILCAREQSGSERGFFLSCKGGNNAESHNHNDIGNFIAYLDGKPIFIDLGTEDYTVKTFSEERYSLWYVQSQYHNCPTVADVLQHDGLSYGAKSVMHRTENDSDVVIMDIASAYPAASGLKTWKREFRLQRGNGSQILLKDVWDRVGNGAVTYNFMSLIPPACVSEGCVRYTYDVETQAVLRYDGESLEARVEEVTLRDSRLRHIWGDAVYRLVLTEKQHDRSFADRSFVIERG